MMNRVTTAPNAGPQALQLLKGPLLMFALLSAGELLFGRIDSAIQLRVAPPEREYVACALFRHLNGQSHRFFFPLNIVSIGRLNRPRPYIRCIDRPSPQPASKRSMGRRPG